MLFSNTKVPDHPRKQNFRPESSNNVCCLAILCKLSCQLEVSDWSWSTIIYILETNKNN